MMALAKYLDVSSLNNLEIACTIIKQRERMKKEKERKTFGILLDNMRRSLNKIGERR
jgi:hypothetical protein